MEKSLFPYWVLSHLTLTDIVCSLERAWLDCISIRQVVAASTTLFYRRDLTLTGTYVVVLGLLYGRVAVGLQGSRGVVVFKSATFWGNIGRRRHHEAEQEW